MMTKKLIKLFENKLFHIAVIFIACLAVYLPNLSHQFVSDDESFFINWQTPKSFSNLPEFFQGAVPQGHEGVYRPVRTLLYAIDNSLWGENPFDYYLQAILLNVVIALLIYGITLKLTKNTIVGFATSLLFGLHPAHTESITWATASMDTFGLALAFGSFYLYLSTNSRKSWKYYFSIFLAFLAFLTYEVALILPLLYVLYEFCLGQKKRSLKKSFLSQWPYFLVVILYLIIRLALFHVVSRMPVNTLEEYFYFLIITSKAFYQYLTLLLFPVNLGLDHVIDGVGSLDMLFHTKLFLSQPVINLHNSLSLLMLISLILIFFRMLKKYPFISFCIGWFLLSLIPVINIIPTETFFNERWVFFASFGFCLLAGWILTYTFSSANHLYKQLLPLRTFILIFIIIFYIVMTYTRNQEWKNGLTLWAKTLQQSPKSSVAWNNLGIAEDKMGKKDLALRYYQNAIVFNPLNAPSHNNIGTLYEEKGQYDKAVQKYKIALTINTANPDYKANFIRAQLKLSGNNTKKKTLSQIQTQRVKRKPDKSENEYLKEINTLLQTNDINAAVSTLKQANIDYPGNSTFLNDLAALSNSQGDYNKALRYLQQAIAIDPSSESIYYNIGTTLEALGKNEEAKKALKTASTLNPDFSEAKEALKKLESKGF